MLFIFDTINSHNIFFRCKWKNHPEKLYQSVAVIIAPRKVSSLSLIEEFFNNVTDFKQKIVIDSFVDGCQSFVLEICITFDYFHSIGTFRNELGDGSYGVQETLESENRTFQATSKRSIHTVEICLTQFIFRNSTRSDNDHILLFSEAI